VDSGAETPYQMTTIVRGGAEAMCGFGVAESIRLFFFSASLIRFKTWSLRTCCFSQTFLPYLLWFVSSPPLIPAPSWRW
jgi:hypothetical protein